ncbi:hypothetical protein [Paracoccus niistensis]|uniref:Uncharacterized protein n=1 Tax=Paracoccus niistensis TaxID=632935 RepID=A0ABV6IAR7_9RHOB
MIRTLLATLVAVLLTYAGCPTARAQASADLGPAAMTGLDAFNGIPDRSLRLHVAMACGNELVFNRRYVVAKFLGKGYKDPGRPEDNGFNTWPIDLMIGKAAILQDPEFEPEDCISRLGIEDEVKRDWARLASDGMAREDETAAQLVSRVYRELYDDPLGANGPACDDVASSGGPGEVWLVLTRSCMARQIHVVMNHPLHGPWTWDDGDPGAQKVLTELPGTEAKTLPCLSEWTIEPDGVKGDWDMAVTLYTRLAHLLYRVGDPDLMLNVGAAVDVLNNRFLTLRSSPEQGATARDSFNLLFSCGNYPNQFGTAADTMSGSGSDPNLGRYPEDGRDAVEETSFWEDLARFFLALLLIAGVVLAGALAGSILWAAGAGTAAAVAIAAVVSTTVIVVGLGTLMTASIEETENHLLMQNSARYLKNKLMMAELSQQGLRKEFDELSVLNEDLRVWLLERMQGIVEDDFVEYNSKPYGRLSHFAILNLLDYACDIQWDYNLSSLMLNADARCDPKDQAVVTAAAAVLDLSAVKAAVGSLDGRRLIPYRRLVVTNQAYYNGSPLLELVQGADTMLAALQVWTGQMAFAPDRRAGPGTFEQLVFYSTSRYRPDSMILSMAINKSTPRAQQYRHATREAYVSGDGWLITAGGTDERPAQGLRFPLGMTIYFIKVPDDDRGVGVPTTLMTRGTALAHVPGVPHGGRVRDFLRFDGRDVNWGMDEGRPLVSFSDNNCIVGSFACGLRPRLPDGYDPASCAVPISDRFVAIDSSLCQAIGNPDEQGIFIAFYDRDGDWGFFEVAPKADFAGSINSFIARVKERNGGHMADWANQEADDEVTYVTTDGRELEFTPSNEDFGADRRACGVVNHVDGAHLTISDVPAAQAASCRSLGRFIDINLNDAMNPVRRAEEGDPLEDLF